MVVTAFALFPVQCPACDSISFTRQVVASKHTAVATQLSTVDTCDGACSCCLLQVLPLELQAEIAQENVSEKLLAEPPHSELSRYSSIFRPPRISQHF